MTTGIIDEIIMSAYYVTEIIPEGCTRTFLHVAHEIQFFPTLNDPSAGH